MIHVPGAIGQRPMETRQSYTDQLTDVLVSLAGGVGNTGFDNLGKGVAALQAASNLYGNVFAIAGIQPADMRTQPIGPCMLRLIAESLIRTGSCAFKIDVTAGRLAFLPVVSWDIDGGPHEASWKYLVDVPSPNGQRSEWLSSAQILHFRYSTDSARPWVGLSPLQRSPLTAGVAVAIETALRDEAGGASGYLLPIPSDPNDPAAAALKADLAGLKGKTTLVRTAAGGWDSGASARPQMEWTPRRLGANPPESLIGLRADVFSHVLAATGVPVSLFLAGEGGGHRESWRRFLHGSVQPLGDIVAEEFGKKLELDVQFSFDRLFASDIQGRARAFQSMVSSGMDMEKAAALSGLLMEEEA